MATERQNALLSEGVANLDGLAPHRVSGEPHAHLTDKEQRRNRFRPCSHGRSNRVVGQGLASLDPL